MPTRPVMLALFSSAYHLPWLLPAPVATARTAALLPSASRRKFGDRRLLVRGLLHILSSRDALAPQEPPGTDRQHRCSRAGVPDHVTDLSCSAPRAFKPGGRLAPRLGTPLHLLLVSSVDPHRHCTPHISSLAGRPLLPWLPAELPALLLFPAPSSPSTATPPTTPPTIAPVLGLDPEASPPPPPPPPPPEEQLGREATASFVPALT